MKINGNPDGGGGGGVITGLTVTENGIYTATGGVDGYSPVNVSVPVPTPVMETLSVDVNGIYTPGVGVDGYSQVIVDVPQSTTGYTLNQIIEGNLGVSVLSSPVTEMKTTGCWGEVTEVNLPNVQTMPSYAFIGNGYLTNVSINNCEYINDSAFYGCASLSQIYMPNVKQIGQMAFFGAGIERLDLSYLSSIIGQQNFTFCSHLSYINLPKVNSLPYAAFQGCADLTYVSLPNCTYAGGYAFGYCSSLTSISLPKCGYVDYNTFESCTSLTEIYLPKCSYLGNTAFQLCSSLSVLSIGTETYIIPYYQEAFYLTPFESGIGSIYVDAAMYDQWITSDGWSNFSSLFVSVGNTDPMLSLSDGIMTGKTGVLYDQIPYDKAEVSAISLPQCTMGYISGYANLTSLSVPLLKSTFEMGLAQNPMLSVVDLPACEWISQYTFFFDTALQEVSLPVCSHIGGLAFQNCDLQKITLGYSSVCTLEAEFGVYNLISIFVPASLVDAYKSAPVWGDYYSNMIYPIP